MTMEVMGIPREKLDQDLIDEFGAVGMYVNEWTLDYGEQGREAVRRLLASLD